MVMRDNGFYLSQDPQARAKFQPLPKCDSEPRIVPAVKNQFDFAEGTRPGQRGEETKG
jgi:hypothetical protein